MPASGETTNATQRRSTGICAAARSITRRTGVSATPMIFSFVISAPSQ